MQRESLIVNPNERHQVELLAHSLALAFEELVQATTPLYPLMRNLRMGNRPGEYSLSGNQSQGSQQNTGVSFPNFFGIPLGNQIPIGIPNPGSQSQQQSKNIFPFSTDHLRCSPNKT